LGVLRELGRRRESSFFGKLHEEKVARDRALAIGSSPDARCLGSGIDRSAIGVEILEADAHRRSRTSATP
jgi:hypothetical protein